MKKNSLLASSSVSRAPPCTHGRSKSGDDARLAWDWAAAHYLRPDDEVLLVKARRRPPPLLW